MTPPQRAAIAAKPTFYHGQQFRSALEARWAVFFNAQEIVWQYEPEKFALTSGVYIPDFHLRWPSGESLWAEVKPGIWDLDDYDRERHAEFANGARLLVLLDGQPEPRPYQVIGERWGVALQRCGVERAPMGSENGDVGLNDACRKAHNVRFKRRR